MTTTTARRAAAGDGITAQRLAAITAELADRFLERSSVARALVVAMLAGQHSLLLGPPGTAKSELARELTSRIDGARYWEILLTKFVPGIGAPGGIIDAVRALRATLRRQELVCSDRRWKQAVRLLQASAWLDGRIEVADTAQAVLTAVLWDSTAQRPAVEREVLQVVNPAPKRPWTCSTRSRRWRPSWTPRPGSPARRCRSGRSGRPTASSPGRGAARRGR
jgi:MoxR-like ATPase